MSAGVFGISASMASNGGWGPGIPAHEADENLDLAFIVTLAGPGKVIGEQIAGLKLAEEPAEVDLVMAGPCHRLCQ